MTENTLDVKAIRARHAACERDPTYGDVPSRRDDPRGMVAYAMIIQSHMDRGALLTEIDRLTSELERAREALKPLADAVFNDNGDMTVSIPYDGDQV